MRSTPCPLEADCGWGAQPPASGLGLDLDLVNESRRWFAPMPESQNFVRRSTGAGVYTAKLRFDECSHDLGGKNNGLDQNRPRYITCRRPDRLNRGRKVKAVIRTIFCRRRKINTVRHYALQPRFVNEGGPSQALVRKNGLKPCGRVQVPGDGLCNATSQKVVEFFRNSVDTAGRGTHPSCPM